jgi:hypothetical protein
MLHYLLFSHHLLTAFWTAYLIAGNPCLVGGDCSTLRANTFTARARTGSVASHTAAATCPTAHAPACSGTHSFWSSTITTWHLNHLLYCEFNEIACSGHSSTQVPHSTHVSALTCAVSFTVIASTGHISAQVPQPVHFVISTVNAIFLSFLHKNHVPRLSFPLIFWHGKIRMIFAHDDAPRNYFNKKECSHGFFYQGFYLFF